MLKKISFTLAVSSFVLFSATCAYAATSLSGYAWSSNIGWLSFNPSDGATVQLSTTTGSSVGSLSGDAWSPNIGWVSFDRAVTGNPPTTGTADPGNGSGAIATVNMTTGAVNGWARALVGCQSDLWATTTLSPTIKVCTGSGPGSDNGVTANSNTTSSTGATTTITYSIPNEYTWTVPAGVTAVLVKTVGAGGESGDSDTCGSPAHGGPTSFVGGWGGDGGYAKSLISVTPGQSYTVLVGSGGTSTDDQDYVGSPSSFGTSATSYITAAYAGGDGEDGEDIGAGCNTGGLLYGSDGTNGSGVGQTVTSGGGADGGEAVVLPTKDDLHAYPVPGNDGSVTISFSSTTVTTTTSTSNTGWDGWIELSGTGHATVTGLTGTATSSAGVSFNTSNNQFSGYAWGSDVVGWLSFNSGSSTTSGTSSPVCLGNNCVTPPTSPTPILSCTNGTSLGTVPAGGGSVTASANNVSVSGGTSPYRYSWNPNSTVGSWTSFSPSTTTTLSYSSIAATNTYSVYVQAEDSANATSNQRPCGTVTEDGTSGSNSPTVGFPELWLGSSATPPANANFQQTTNASGNYLTTANIQPVTVLPGSSVTVSYAYPAGLLSCAESLTLPSGVSSLLFSPDWSGLLLKSISGSTQLQNLSQGTYYIQYSCNEPSVAYRYSNPLMAALHDLFASNPTPTAALSNQIEIDVVPSSIHEN